MNLNFSFIFHFLSFHRCNNISSFIVVYIDIWHIVTACYVLMCFSIPLKSIFLATKNVSPPTVFELGGWNTYHFVGNLIPYIVTYHFFNIWYLFPVKTGHTNQKICKKYEFCLKNFDLLFKFLFFRNLKNRFVTLCS